MKTIIRIEHNCGNGLWWAKDNGGESLWRLLSFADELNDKHWDFPTPESDELHILKDEYCAFKSIEQIQQWIESEWFDEIIDIGFKIWMIDVSDWKEGNYQILFKKSDIISKKDISILFKQKKLK